MTEHNHTFCPHCKPCRHAGHVCDLESAMVGLASQYGNGPGGGDFTTTGDMADRIREGVNTIIDVERGRQERLKVALRKIVDESNTEGVYDIVYRALEGSPEEAKHG